MSGRVRTAIRTGKGKSNQSKVKLTKEHILPRGLHSKGRKVNVEVQRKDKTKKLPREMVEISMSKKFGMQVNSPKQQVIIYNQIKKRLEDEHISIDVVKSLRLLNSISEADSLLTTRLNIATPKELSKLPKEELVKYNKKVISNMKLFGKLGFIVGGSSFVPVITNKGIKPVLADFKNIVKI